jgi:hypothetical protein
MAKPTHIAYAVRNFEKDNKGFDVTLDAAPVSRRVVLRVNEPKARGGDPPGASRQLTPFRTDNSALPRLGWYPAGDGGGGVNGRILRLQLDRC